MINDSNILMIKSIRRAIKIFMPPIVGVVILMLLFKIEAFLNYQRDGNEGDVIMDSDLLIMTPMIFISLIIHGFILILRDSFKKQDKVQWSFLIKFVLIISLIGGFLFGLMFWARQFGFKDFVITCLMGIISLGVLLSADLFTYILIDKLLNKIKNAT